MHLSSLEQHVEKAAEKTKVLFRSRYGLWMLGAISFFESALPVPILTDPFLIAYILADRSRAFVGFLVTLTTSILGGLFAYVLAFAFYEHLVEPYISTFLSTEFQAIIAEFQAGTFVITVLGALTPVPYTVVAIAAGFVKGNIWAFIAGSFVGRVIRYGIVGWLTYAYGHQALAIVRRRLLAVSVICFFAAILYFYLKH